MSVQIREYIQAYKASLAADSNTTLPPICSSLHKTFRTAPPNVPPDELRFRHCHIAYRNYIAHLPLLSFVAVYDAQVQQTEINQEI